MLEIAGIHCLTGIDPKLHHFSYASQLGAYLKEPDRSLKQLV